MEAPGGVSTLSMIVCCSHHLVEILPVIGLSAASVFLVKYQISFILIGVFSNLIGIQTMLGIIQKHHLYEENGVLEKLLISGIKKGRFITVSIAIIVVAIFLSQNQNRTGTMPDLMRSHFSIKANDGDTLLHKV